MVVLGLDISTACTGYCIIKKSGSKLRLIDAGVIKLDKLKDFYQKSIRVEDFLKLLHAKHGFNAASVEENLQSFRPGMSSAKTILSLAKFNGVSCFLVERTTGIKPAMVSVTRARSKLGIKINRKSGIKTKDQVLDWVKKHPVFAGFNWPTKTLKSGPRRGVTIEDSSCFDIADAAVVALFSII